MLTNRRFTEFFFGHLVGEIGAHQNVTLYSQILLDYLGYQFDAVSFASSKTLQMEFESLIQRIPTVRRSCFKRTLIRDRPTAVGFMLSSSVEHNVRINWCGKTKMRMSASFAASTTSGTAIWKEIQKGSVWNYYLQPIGGLNRSK